MTKHTILFLAANPLGTDRLALDEEARAIHAELERSGHRDKFELVTRWAVQPLDLLRELRKLMPTVVHFSGHGGQVQRQSGQQSRRDVVGKFGGDGSDHQSGLFFQGSDGRPQIVSTMALQETFGAAGASVKLIVLSACYSEQQAEALLEHVDCVVGMGGSVCDDAARNFAVGFYGGLGEQQSIEGAYRQGRAAISLDGLPDNDQPQLRARTDVDAGQLVLAKIRAEGIPALFSNRGRDEFDAFDVFFCHNVTDKETVEEIADGLRQLGLNPLLDHARLCLGDPWAMNLHEQIGRISAAVVFVGASGIGPWQEAEILDYLCRLDMWDCPVLPVLLPGCPDDPSLPWFIKVSTAVDLREVVQDPIKRVYLRITSQKLAGQRKRSRRRFIDTVDDKFSRVSRALEQLIASNAGVDALKAFVEEHKETLLSLPAELRPWNWMEIVTNFCVNRRLRPQFTQFKFSPPDCQLASCIAFVVLADVKTCIFLDGIMKTPEIKGIEGKLRGCIQAVRDNYDEYCSRAVMQDVIKTIPLSVLLSRPAYCQAVLVAGRRRYLTQGQLDYLAKCNVNGPVRLVTYDALIDGSLRSRF